MPKSHANKKHCYSDCTHVKHSCRYLGVQSVTEKVNCICHTLRSTHKDTLLPLIVHDPHNELIIWRLPV